MSNYSTESLIQKGIETKGFDPRNLSKNTIRMFMMVGVGILLYIYLLPYLKDLVWDTVQLAEGIIALGVLGIIIYALWKNIGTMADMLSRNLLGWLIEYDPWALQYQQLDLQEKDAEEVSDQTAKIQARWVQNTNSLNVAKQEVQEAYASIEILKQTMKKSGLNDDQMLQLQQQLGDQQSRMLRNQTYIEDIGPQTSDMETILKIAKTSSVIMKHKIQNSRLDLKTLKDSYDTSSEGAKAMMSMKRALKGNTELNNKAEQSKLVVMRRIALNMGQMRESINVISDITADANLNDAAKLKVATQRLQELGAGIEIPLQKNSNFQNVLMPGNNTYNLPD